MKNTVYFLVLALGINVLLSSCGSTIKFAIDDTYPPDQVATIYFKDGAKSFGFLITEWNGVNIEKDIYEKVESWSSKDTTIITVPPGINKLTFDATFYTDEAGYRIRDIRLEYNFETGKKYEIRRRVNSKGFLFNVSYEFFIGVYDITSRKEKLLKEWQIGASK